MSKVDKMIIKTASGDVSINKKSPYGKWFLGWTNAGGFSGVTSLKNAWGRAVTLKMPGCSWYCLGSLMAKEQKFGKGCVEK
jgi:hypothetical protein